jgi:CDP-diacylglycerol--glycerol-3-phosphate 3-phosphatidyltransferase
MATMTPKEPVAVFNLPNQLTVSRLVLAVVLFVLIAFQLWLWSLAIFALAALTDWLDGYLARVQGLTSSLGRMLDPLVDKVLMCGTFIFLLPEGSKEDTGWLTPWMVVVVVSREFLITGLRSYLESLGIRFGADWLGKLKMVLQCACVIAILFSLYAPTEFWGIVRDGSIYAMLVATILSGVQYLWRGLAILRNEADKANP